MAHALEAVGVESAESQVNSQKVAALLFDTRTPWSNDRSVET
jgi:hypothetical protein